MDVVNLQSLLMREWGLLPPRTVTFVPNKHYSVVGILDFGDEKKVLKATTINSPERQEAVNRCMGQVHACGLPVPSVHKTQDSKLYAVQEGRTITLMDYLPGKPYEGSDVELKEAGKILARFHQAVENSPLSDSLLSEPVYPNDRELLEQLRSHPGVPGRVASSLLASYDVAPTSFGLPAQLGHFDFNGSNLLVHDGQISGLLDFDLIRVAERARDVSIAMHKLNRSNQSPERHRLFLDAYQSVSALHQHELDALDDLYFDETRRKLTYILRSMCLEDAPLEQELQNQISQMKELTYFDTVTKSL